MVSCTKRTNLLIQSSTLSRVAPYASPEDSGSFPAENFSSSFRFLLLLASFFFFFWHFAFLYIQEEPDLLIIPQKANFSTSRSFQLSYDEISLIYQKLPCIPGHCRLPLSAFPEYFSFSIVRIRKVSKKTQTEKNPNNPPLRKYHPSYANTKLCI